eukprot:TRINITY_DN50516_c0_g1_i1.p1 TRINITY_DN50516_c0_g1~~TRINITY_DN50516_c0_g1_i1.p1  ORF type:complete len:390 (-),score=117.08 TRINITY_DN50516_c0_g1_i1:130-1299(-)
MCIRDSIVYYGPLSSAAFFLQPLMREDAFMDDSNAFPWIVIIDSDEQDVNLFEPQMVKRWEKLTFYDKLYIMQGEVIEPHVGLPWCSPSTFTRAGVERASIFVMPHSSEAVHPENLLGDEEVIRVLRNLREHVMIHRHAKDVMRFKPLFIVELLHRHHIEYIRRPLPRPMAYAAGQVVHAQFMDIFPGKMFYSSASLPILEHLISSWDTRPYVDVSDRHLGYNHIESCHLVLRDVPASFHNKSFGEFFDHCAANYCVCMGLYRHHHEWGLHEEARSELGKNDPAEQNAEEHADEQMLRDLRYVYVNPRPRDILHPKDKAYLLVNMTWYDSDLWHTTTPADVLHTPKDSPAAAGAAEAARASAGPAASPGEQSMEMGLLNEACLKRDVDM